MADLLGLRAVAGLALFVFPGAAWTWALAPKLGWARAAPLALVLSFTLLPALLFVLNLLFGLPLHLGTMTMFATALGLAGVSVAIAPVAMGKYAG